ncbi:phosphoglucomutase/phosphomannomutase family protein [Candidatus Saganbacteria bacterium]|nr:phosphoglucomutase/phosphomannomutase family protein [Candidatus Saganbacteria bacterium]
MVKFGTDGWRAKIAEDFTFDNVRRVTRAMIDALKLKSVAVGFDNRFQSEDFAKAAAEVCAAAGIKTYLSSASLPSPALSFRVKDKGLDGGIMITASHNPPEWNGFKIKESFGGSARPEVTQKVEQNLRLNAAVPEPRGSLAGSGIETFDPKPDYLKHISSFVDLEVIKKAKLRIIVDPMHGSGAGYLKELLPVDEIRGNRDPLFGGVNPEPIPVNLEETLSYVREQALKYPNDLTVGIVLDGDSDRIGCVDATGTFISSHNVFSLLLHHLVENRKMSGKVVKTFNLTRLVEKQAKKYGLPLAETPIGFKYIADLMLKEKVLLGGEESGGLGILGNIPERDGNLCALLLLEMMAMEKKTLKQILDGIMDELGHYYYDRADLRVEKRIEVPRLKEFGGMPVTKIEDLDGVKFNFADESWILFRASGTEPLLRIYSEGRTQEQCERLLAEGEKLFGF